MTVELPAPFERRIETITEKELEVREMTRESLRAYYQRRVLRDEAESPKLASMAPDISLERLSAEGARTGEFVALSSLRGRPAGLIFGSFT